LEIGYYATKTWPKGLCSSQFGTNRNKNNSFIMNQDNCSPIAQNGVIANERSLRQAQCIAPASEAIPRLMGEAKLWEIASTAKTAVSQ
jgi:hypothetical protein